MEYCDTKHLCIASTWSRKADIKRKINGSGCNKSEIDLCMIGKVDRKFFLNVNVITGELQHNLEIVDIDKKQTKENRVGA